MPLLKQLLVVGVLLLPSYGHAISVAPVAPKLPQSFLPVPIVRQATDYSCGAAALLGTLQYWKTYDGSESSLYEDLETTPKDGTEPDKIVEVAQQFGLVAYRKEGLKLADLREALRREQTVILALQAWREPENAHIPWSDNWEDGHYVVLIGMDRQFAYVMDPAATAGYTYVPLNELLERWHDYENRHGYVWRYYRLGIFIRGKKALKTLPGPLIRME